MKGCGLFILLIAQALRAIAAAADAPPERATFVGTFVDVKELTCPDDRRVEPGTKYEFRPWVDEHGHQIVVMCEPTEFELTYRIDRVLAGHVFPRHTIKFRADANTMTCTHGMYVDDMVRASETPTKK